MTRVVKKKMNRKGASWWREAPELGVAEMRKARGARKFFGRDVSGRMIFYQVVLLFVIGCIFGTYWEEIQVIVRTWLATGAPEWESRRGLVFGPFSPVYGIGAALIYLGFYLPRLKGWVCFVGGAVFGGALEYGLSWVQEWIFQTRSWDYSELWLNIGGRTTVPYMVVWGALVFGLVRWVCPFVDEMCRKVTEKRLRWFCLVLAGVMVIDITVSIAAVWRQEQRREGEPADSVVDEMLDEEFPDERLEEIYSNTEVAE